MKTSVFVKKESEKNMEDKMKQALLECCERNSVILSPIVIKLCIWFAEYGKRRIVLVLEPVSYAAPETYTCHAALSKC